jgi:MMP 1-O-methyltransferase
MDLATDIQNISREIQRFQSLVSLNDIPGFLQWEEGYALLTLAESWPGPDDIVEIGSYKGRSTCFLAAGCRLAQRGRVVAVDHFRKPPKDDEMPKPAGPGTAFQAFQHHLYQTGLGDRIHPLVGDAVMHGQCWEAPVRMLFLDGDHSYAATKAHYAAWSRHVASGGLICFHDCAGSLCSGGVSKFVNDEILPAPDLAVMGHIGGLIVFIKK